MKKKTITIGLVALLLLVLAIPLYFTWLRYCREGRKAQCKRNLMYIGLLCKMYSQEHGEIAPASGFAPLFTAGVCDTPEIFVCPSSGKQPGNISIVDEWTDYEFFAIVPTDDKSLPLEPVLYCKHACEVYDGYTNVMWGDGHVSWEHLETLNENKNP